MSPPPDEMISWVVEKVALSGAEGVSISDLFDGVNAHLSSKSQPPIDANAKDSIWKSLVARQDFDIVGAKAPILKTLPYQTVLDLEFGETKVKIQQAVSPPLPNGSLVQPPVQPSVPVISPTQVSRPSQTPLVPSIEEYTQPAAQARLAPTTQATLRSESPSAQNNASPSSKRKPRKDRESTDTGPKPVERKTNRKWLPKSHHLTQEEAQREEDGKQYAAGVARVYIDPPGSARPSEHQGKPKKSLKQKIAVFKSLYLTDPSWLVHSRGSWWAEYEKRRVALEGNRVAETISAATQPSPEMENSQVDQAVDTLFPALSPTSTRRQAPSASDANSVNDDIAPPKKRLHRRKTIDTPETFLPTPDMGNPFPPIFHQTDDVAAPHPDKHQYRPPPPSPVVPSEHFQTLPSSSLQYQQPAAFDSPGFYQPISGFHQQGAQPHLQVPQNTPQYHGMQPTYQQAQQSTPQYHSMRHPYPDAVDPALQNSPPLVSESMTQHTSEFYQPSSGVGYQQQSELVRNGADSAAKRIGKACSTCRNRKIKCVIQDGSRACHHCESKKLDCDLTGHLTNLQHAALHKNSTLQPAPSTPSPQSQNQSIGLPVGDKSPSNQVDIEDAAMSWSNYTCSRLKRECEIRNLPTNGLKAALIERLSRVCFAPAEVMATPQTSRSVTQEPAAQQPALQQEVTTIRSDFLSRITQNAPKPYQSPYETSGDPAKSHTQTAADLLDETQSETAAGEVGAHPKSSTLTADANGNQLEGGVETEVPKSAKKRGRPKKVAKGRVSQSIVLSQRNANTTSSRQEASPENISPALEGVAPLQDISQLDPRGTIETQQAASVEPNQDSESIPTVPATNHSTQSDLKTFPPPLAPASVADQRNLRKVSSFASPQDSTSPQNITDATEAVLHGQFQPSSADGDRVPSGIQYSGFGFLHDSLTSEHPPYANSPRTSLPPAGPSLHPHPLPPRRAQMPTNHSHSHLDQNQNHMHSRQMHGKISHSNHVQQSPYAYLPATAGGQSNRGIQSGYPHTHHVPGNTYSPLPYGTTPISNDPPQQLHHPAFHQPQVQGPPLGYFSSPSPQLGLSTPTVSTQASSVTTKKRKHDSMSTAAPTPQSTQSSTLETLARSSHDAPMTNTTLRKPQRLAELEAMEAIIQHFAADAEAVDIPDIFARLFASYDNVVGNLVLSQDKTQLMFHALDQEPLEDPLLIIKVEQIKEHPLVSMKGSRPMELRVKYEDEGENEVLCRFYVGQSATAYESANKMRAAIVTARIACRVAAGETNTYELFKENTVTNIEVVKPYKCEKCDKRFKNKEGIKYHLEKSNTTCNPKFVPPTNPPKRQKISHKGKEPSTKPTTKKGKKVDFVENGDPVDQRDPLLQTAEIDDSSDTDSSSDDSILAWAEKVAFANPGETIKSAVSTPKKSITKARRFPVENDVLQVLIEEAVNSTAPEETIDSVVEGVLQELVEEVVDFTALQQQLPAPPVVADSEIRGINANTLSDRISSQRGKDIVLDLVGGNFGIFPGDKSLWFAFIAIWIKKYSRSGVLPSSKLCSDAVDQLVQDKKLTQTTFPIRENDSMAPTRSIISLATSDLGSNSLQKLQELIQMAYPKVYVPSKFAPPRATVEKLQAFFDGTLILEDAKPSKKRQDYNRLATMSREDLTRIIEYDYNTEDDYSVHSEDTIEDLDDNEGDSDSYNEDGQRRDRRSDPRVRQSQAQRMKSYWAASKAAGSNVLMKVDGYIPIDIGSSPSSKSLSHSPGEDRPERPSRSRFGRPKAKPRAWKGGPIPVHERERRRIIQANKLLNYAPACLPNPETGAWDQVSLHVTPLRGKRSRVLKYQLPEPITYLQSENGAWDTRAYGHGAPPVFVRPARRADGNPALQAYIKRISKGHRPILYPQKNRLFLPAAASKIILGTGIRKKSGEPKKRSKSEMSNVSASEDEDEDRQLKPNPQTKKRKSTLIPPEGEEIEPTPKRRRIRFTESRPEPRLGDDVDPDFHTSSVLQPPANTTPRVTRNVMRGGQELDEIQMLSFFEPRSFSEIDNSPNPGLLSLPTSFWAGRSISTAPGADHSATVAAHNPTPGLKGFEKVAAWEQGPGSEMLARRTKAAGYGWINHTVDAMESSFDTETIKLKWVDNANFKIEDLPYDKLADIGDIEEAGSAEATARPNVQIAQPLKKVQRRPKKARVHRSRRLTAWHTDFDGVLNQTDPLLKELDVQVAPKTNTQYNRALDGTMSGQEEVRFLVAVMVITTLTGGVGEAIDWVLVNMLFPNYSNNYLRRVWGRMFKTQKTFIEGLTAEFQKAFLSAYETDELPKIDYENLAGYEWAKVIDWAVKKIYRRNRDAEVLLPISRKEVKKIWNLKEQDSGAHNTRETYFNPSTAIYKRMDAISAIARTLPAEPVPGPMNADDIEIDEVTLARSWIKALVFTPQDEYDIEVAQEKMIQLGEVLVAEVRKALIEEKVIMHPNKGRPTPGRIYEPTETFNSALRKHINEKHFAQAVECKKFLDAEFSRGVECVRSEYTANEGTVMCITNLQAHGRITLKGVNVPMNKFGLTGGGYETRKMPKNTFIFNMDIYPTASYLFDEEIPALQMLEFLEPPRGGEAGEIPLWYGITDNLIPDLWKRALVAVSGVTALRAGASVASLERTLRPALEEWEIWRLMKWGTEVGLVKRIDESHEGWTMGEWWWLIVGRFCDDE